MVIMVASVACLQNVRHEHGDVYNFERAFFLQGGAGQKRRYSGRGKTASKYQILQQVNDIKYWRIVQAFPQGTTGRLFFSGAGPASRGVHPWWQW